MEFLIYLPSNLFKLIGIIGHNNKFIITVWNEFVRLSDFVKTPIQFITILMGFYESAYHHRELLCFSNLPSDKESESCVRIVKELLPNKRTLAWLGQKHNLYSMTGCQPFWGCFYLLRIFYWSGWLSEYLKSVREPKNNISYICPILYYAQMEVFFHISRKRNSLRSVLDT